MIKRTSEAFYPDGEAKSDLASSIPHTENVEDLKQILEIWLTLFDKWFFGGSIRHSSIELVLINNS